MYLQEFTATNKKLKQRVVVYSIGHNEYDAADKLYSEYTDIHFTGRESKLGKDWDNAPQT